ncbi:hypothetical protein DSO57_1016144 [Entomophthora muscae]|uniref:Uncharacterized protein n=1 Tax=Entomophthora muscae TaxID=34485 RepID=A0ACC2T4V5_9FUNG|nr:hypothetical protein DSO57_1016144 [Entomophthora muscae]
MPASPTSESTPQPIFLHVLVVGFHHLKGPLTEYCYPELPKFSPIEQEKPEDKTESPEEPKEASQEPEKGNTSGTEAALTESDGELNLPQLPSEWAFLPFAALPDGSHQRDTGSSFFTLPSVNSGPAIYHQTLFGISTFRQIETEKVINKTKDMSRTFIQKAIVVIARMPAIGPICEKLSQVTEAYFNQLDFSDLTIFKDFYSSLMNLMGKGIPDDLFYSGLPLPQFVTLFQEKSLVLVKLLLLQRKVLFYGTTMEKVGKFQFSLLCLIGDISRFLNHSGDPSAEHLELMENNQALSTSTSIQEMVSGFNPPIFGKGCAFQPCLTLQQIDLFMSSPDVRSFLIGSTNQLFEVKDDFYHVRVNVDSGDIFFQDSNLEELLRLSSADFKFMNSICEAVKNLETLETDSSSGFEGSSTHIRMGFIAYYQALAASVLYSHSLKLQAKDNLALKEENRDRVAEILDEFNLDWVNSWARTPNFKALIALINSDSELAFDLKSLGHPGHGATIFDSIQIKLSSQIKNIRLEKNLAPVVESIGKASGKISQAFSGMYADIQKSVDGKVSKEGAVDLSQKIATGFSSWFSAAKSKVASHLEQLEETFVDKSNDAPAPTNDIQDHSDRKDHQKVQMTTQPQQQETITKEPVKKHIQPKQASTEEPEIIAQEQNTNVIQIETTLPDDEEETIESPQDSGEKQISPLKESNKGNKQESKSKNLKANQDHTKPKKDTEAEQATQHDEPEVDSHEDPSSK